MTFKKESLLKAIKVTIIVLMVFMIYQILKISIAELKSIFNDNKLTIIQYLWMEPLIFDKESLRVITDEQKVSLSENFIITHFIVYKLSPFLALCIIVGCILIYLNYLIQDIIKADSVNEIIHVIFVGISWLFAWVTVNSINQKWPEFLNTFKDIWRSSEHVTPITILFQFLFEFIIAYAFIYGFKSVYLVVFKKIVKLPRYIADKSMGN